SATGAGPFGVGFSLPMTYIERDMRASPSECADPSCNPSDPRQRFWLVRNGERKLLVAFPSNQAASYRADVEAVYLNVVAGTDNTGAPNWVATDGQGTRLIFDLAYDRNGAIC